MSRIIFLYLIALFGSGSQAPAGTFYVATNGSNGNPGTMSRPWHTISYAVSTSSRVMAGDTILIRAGNYPETVTPEISGTATLPIVICSYNVETVTLNPGRFRFETGINYWHLAGLTIEKSSGSGVSVSGTHAVNFLTVQNCTVLRHKEDGIFLGGNFGGVIILECHIEYNGEWHGVPQTNEGHGLVIYGGGPGKLTIKRNLIANNWHKGLAYGSEVDFAGDGTEIDSNMIINNYESGCDFSPDNSFFRYNYVSRNGLRDTETGEFGDKGFMTTPYCRNSTIAFNVIRSSGGNEIAPLGSACFYYHNTLYKDVPYTAVPGSPYQAVIMFYDSYTPHSVFRNNIICNLLSRPQHHYAIISEIYQSYTSQTWSHNLYWCPNATGTPSERKPFKLYNAPGPGGMYKTIAEVQASWPGEETHSLSSSPGFVSVPDSNFTLQGDSPAIDAGIDVGFHYNGQAPDIGRYEYVGGGDLKQSGESKPPLLNYLRSSGAVMSLDKIGAEKIDVNIDPITDRLNIESSEF
jgi:hypothetical protein